MKNMGKIKSRKQQCTEKQSLQGEENKKGKMQMDVRKDILTIKPEQSFSLNINMDGQGEKNSSWKFKKLQK